MKAEELVRLGGQRRLAVASGGPPCLAWGGQRDGQRVGQPEDGRRVPAAALELARRAQWAAADESVAAKAGETVGAASQAWKP